MSFPDINNIDDLISAINEYFTSPRRPPLKGEEANFVLLKLLSLVVQYTDDQITALKGGAPEAYDTLMEIAEKLADDDGEIADLLTLINSKADVSDLDAKVDKAEGYGLSKNDYSDVDKALVDTISSKQDALSFDEEPQSGSNNSVKSGGIWAFVNNKVDDIQDQIDSIELNTDAVDELPGATNKYFTESRVLSSILTGVSFVVSTAIVATDSLLQALGKLQAQITTLNGSLSSHIADHTNPHQVTLEQVRTQNNQLAGDIDANNNHIINLADATDRKHALTKGQFDDAFNAAGRNKGGIDCSGNPNYPASNSGDRWEVTVAGKIGGASGVSVDIYDEIVCKTTSAGGNHATVGTNFYIVQGNISRATETTTGYSQIATNAQAVAMTNDDAFLTPLKGAALVDQKRKTVNYQINPVSLNEVSVLMENAGQVNSVLISGASAVKLKIGIAGTYPVGTQTYPFSYAAGDRVFITYNYTDLANATCNVKLKCQDN